MPSLTYQIIHMTYDKTKIYRQDQHDKDGNILRAACISTQSERMYRNHVVKFGKWCAVTYGCRTPADCALHIQDYSNWLVRQGKSASTVHTYLAGVCRYFNVPLSNIEKPRRIGAEFVRSRGQKLVDSRNDSMREASPRLYDFARVVGCRRNEYQRLRGNDFVQDETGHWCVRICRGKGGKYQEQRILPDDVEFVKSYFDGSDNYIFSAAEMKNKIDLHHLRALQAQRAYVYYQELIKDTDSRTQLIQELQARWEHHNNKKRWNPRLIEGYYYLRGANRKLAQEHGLPTQYDKLAVMAVSVFMLSHWRTDVTICDYLLAE